MRRGAGVAVAAVAVLSGCASAVNVPPGPYAADPVCAEVLQLLPGELDGGEERSITSQATAAWGEPPVTLRCGVEVPGPSTELCITVESRDTSVDWLALGSDDETVSEHAQLESGSWTFVTYGRVPAIEVVVPTERGGGQPTAVLAEIASAVERSTAERNCVGIGDVP